jgi:hypothetical protein
MLIFYLEKTKTLRGNITQLFITMQKPYKAVTRDTICRWTRTVLIKSGIDVNIFKPHSTFVLVDQKAITITLAVFEKFEVNDSKGDNPLRYFKTTFTSHVTLNYHQKWLQFCSKKTN